MNAKIDGNYPSGLRLTMKTAKALAVQEFGTAKGLEREDGMENCFRMELGNLSITIRPDTCMSRYITVRARLSSGGGRSIGFYDRETLKPDFDALMRYELEEKQNALEQWVFADGPEPCHKAIEACWKRGNE